MYTVVECRRASSNCSWVPLKRRSLQWGEPEVRWAEECQLFPKSKNNTITHLYADMAGFSSFRSSDMYFCERSNLSDACLPSRHSRSYVDNIQCTKSYLCLPKVQIAIHAERQRFTKYFLFEFANSWEMQWNLNSLSAAILTRLVYFGGLLKVNL